MGPSQPGREGWVTVGVSPQSPPVFLEEETGWGWTWKERGKGLYIPLDSDPKDKGS